MYWRKLLMITLHYLNRFRFFNLPGNCNWLCKSIIWFGFVSIKIRCDLNENALWNILHIFEMVFVIRRRYAITNNCNKGLVSPVSLCGLLYFFVNHWLSVDQLTNWEVCFFFLSLSLSNIFSLPCRNADKDQITMEMVKQLLHVNFDAGMPCSNIIPE